MRRELRWRDPPRHGERLSSSGQSNVFPLNVTSTGRSAIRSANRTAPKMFIRKVAA